MLIKAVIEMPIFTQYKYEIKDNVIILDRVVHPCVPQNYGFIPDTLAEDGDPLDVFVIGQAEQALAIGALTKIQVLGLIRCYDGGLKDDKVVAIVPGVMEYDLTRDLPYAFNQIKRYLLDYKDGMLIEERVRSKAFAESRIKRCQKRFLSGEGLE